MIFLNRHRRLRDQLSAYIDGQLRPDEAAALEAHLESCGACRDELAELRVVASTLQSLPEEAAPRSFALTPETARRPEAPVRRAPVSGGGALALAGGMRLAVAALACALAVVLVVDVTDIGGNGRNGGTTLNFTTGQTDMQQSGGQEPALAPGDAETSGRGLTATPQATAPAGGFGVGGTGTGGGTTGEGGIATEPTPQAPTSDGGAGGGGVGGTPLPTATPEAPAGNVEMPPAGEETPAAVATSTPAPGVGSIAGVPATGGDNSLGQTPAPQEGAGGGVVTTPAPTPLPENDKTNLEPAGTGQIAGYMSAPTPGAFVADRSVSESGDDLGALRVAEIALGAGLAVVIAGLVGMTLGGRRRT